MNLHKNISSDEILAKVEQLEKRIHGPKLLRILSRFPKYVTIGMMRFRKTFNQDFQILVESETCMSTSLQIMLPGGVDLYLFGMKSHHSEIRLSKYLLRHVCPGDVVIDCGAHYGFYAQLCSHLVKKNGHVYAIEPSRLSYEILEENAKNFNNLTIYPIAIGNVNKAKLFYEFPPQYAEYNAQSVEQYKNETWFNDVDIQSTTVRFERLDQFMSSHNISPAFIKIDVEGGELEAIQGLGSILDGSSTKIILEFLNDGRPNESYFKATEILTQKQFYPKAIDENGFLISIDSISHYLERVEYESDNIVFTRDDEGC